MQIDLVNTLPVYQLIPGLPASCAGVCLNKEGAKAQVNCPSRVTREIEAPPISHVPHQKAVWYGLIGYDNCFIYSFKFLLKWSWIHKAKFRRNSIFEMKI